MKNKIKNFFKRFFAVFLVVLSISLLWTDWIHSTVLSNYQGIFSTSSKLADMIIEELQDYTEADITSLKNSIIKLADGSTGPYDLYVTCGTVIDSSEELLDLLHDHGNVELTKTQRNHITLFIVSLYAYRVIFNLVIILGAIQCFRYIFKGHKLKLSLIMIGQGIMCCLFFAFYYYLNLIVTDRFRDLDFRLTAFFYIALFTALPYLLLDKFFFLAGKLLRLVHRLVFIERSKRARKISAGVLVFLVLFISVAGGYSYYAYLYRGNHEPASNALVTNTDPVYSDEYFKKTLSNYGFTKDYDLDQIVRNSYVVPGLKTTKTLHDGELSTCTSMTPQGVCVADDYILISSYCASKTHNSVVYVVDKDSHAFVKEIVLPGRPHVGGISYDPRNKNIWICGFDGSSNTAYANAFTMDALENYDIDSKKPISYIFKYPIYSMDRTSFMDYYSNRIYVGYFESSKDAVTTVQGFSIGSDGGLISNESDNRYYQDFLSFMEGSNLLVPSDVNLINGGIQGFSMTDGYVVISQSGGPINSRLMMFKDNGNWSQAVKTSDKALETLTLPPMLEQISLEDKKMYLCFESAAYAYRARLNPKIDRIVVIDMTKKIDES